MRQGWQWSWWVAQPWLESGASGVVVVSALSRVNGVGVGGATWGLWIVLEEIGAGVGARWRSVHSVRTSRTVVVWLLYLYM